MAFFVYILTNKNKTTLYVGFTNNLKRRLFEHAHPKEGSGAFSKRYNVIYLVYYEVHDSPLGGIAREKEIKKWRREKKDQLIATLNPEWKFLNEELE